ncbi:hypothetical protein GCM10011386_33310 [Parapedobacter defluvii]|uniref:Uncharacterized protein n=1 Tax=Parapedobacter defluvii TaxID=2045106 RepID=A0ABQ1MD79_9SPHI|nr:hypothetical protein GCM10011386_33310 [Parapedobacter defluvii]
MPNYKINRISKVLEEKGMKNNDLVVHLKVKKETRFEVGKQQAATYFEHT